ncbi:heme peroxidase, partial [Mycena crocata]
PSPYDFLEDAYTVTSGFADGGIVDELNPCSSAPFGGRLPGRHAASEWLRLAYHDMATQTGLGGLDASIGFETNRAQDIGSAMDASLAGNTCSTTCLFSQLNMCSVILAIKNCGGPSIPFRAGRTDAESAGPATVPEPHQDLASHTASFASQGFNMTEMIGLVACGHTIAGMHQVDFPLSVKNATSPSSRRGWFTLTTLLTRLIIICPATQWIARSSVNPLAIGFNDTTNSNARIFAADGNQTMQSFAQVPTFFSFKCGGLFERMLNTVTRIVQLSDVIQPLPVKPYELVLSTSDGSLVMSGYIRVRSLFESNSSTLPIYDLQLQT